MFSVGRRLPDLRRVRPARHRSGSLALHPYFGKLDPALARALVDHYSRPGDVVLDPFCGSGTVLNVALLAGRAAVGWDSSPLALLIATAKVLGLEPSEERELQRLESDLRCFSSAAPMFRQPVPERGVVPPMPRVNDVGSWFQPNALRELAYISWYLDSKRPTLATSPFILSKIAFSRIIVAASNQQGESSYRRVKKRDTPGRVIDLFLTALQEIAAGSRDFHGQMVRGVSGDSDRLITTGLGVSRVMWGDVRGEIHLRDARTEVPRSVEHPTAQVVVSSPPYLMSWDYGLYHKFRFYWLGLDLDTYEDTEIGRHLRRKQDDVDRYRLDMTQAFRAMSAVVSANGHIVLVNAPAIVYGREVDTNALLGDCARDAGWKMAACLPSLEIPGPHHGMYASLRPRGATAAGEGGKREHVLVFERA